MPIDDLLHDKAIGALIDQWKATGQAVQNTTYNADALIVELRALAKDAAGLVAQTRGLVGDCRVVFGKIFRY